MKNSINLFSSVLILALFTKCASSQFDKKPPFTVAGAKYQEWVGGKPGSKGTLVTITFAAKVDDNIKFDSIYFNDRAMPINADFKNDKTTVSANFVNTDIKDKMIIMHRDPKKEFGNKPPIASKKSPFQLAENECVIGYTFNTKKRYFKLDKLEKGKPIIYP